MNRVYGLFAPLPFRQSAVNQTVPTGTGARRKSFQVLDPFRAAQLWYSQGVSGGAPPITARYARPISDVTPGAWLPSTGSALYAMIDEADPPDDSDYIYTLSASTCDLGLNAVANPGTTQGQIVSYRISSANGAGLTITLKQGATVIATWTHASVPLALTTFTQALTAGQIALIDYSQGFDVTMAAL